MHACISPVHVFFLFPFLKFFFVVCFHTKFDIFMCIYIHIYVYKYIYMYIQYYNDHICLNDLQNETFQTCSSGKNVFHTLVRLRYFVLWVTLLKIHEQFLFGSVANNPHAPSCTRSCSIRVRGGCFSRTMSLASLPVTAVIPPKRISWYIWYTMKDFFFPKFYSLVQFFWVSKKLFSHRCNFPVVWQRCCSTTGPYTKLSVIIFKINLN